MLIPGLGADTRVHYGGDWWWIRAEQDIAYGDSFDRIAGFPSAMA